jgi:ABC-type phosphate transport system auxiliary subunit
MPSQICAEQLDSLKLSIVRFDKGLILRLKTQKRWIDMSLTTAILVVVVVIPVIFGIGLGAFWDANVRGWNKLAQEAEGVRDFSKCLEENKDCSKQQARAFEKCIERESEDGVLTDEEYLACAHSIYG